MKDFYYILGLKDTASSQEIKQAYRKLSVKFHPDKNNGDKFFEDRFKEIQEAYDTLSDATGRQNYDLKRRTFYGSSQNEKRQEKPKEEPPPEIREFSADKLVLNEGEIVQLKWRTIHADEIVLSCFSGEQDANGIKNVKISGFKNKDVIHITISAKNLKSGRSTSKILVFKNQQYEVNKKKDLENDEKEALNKRDIKTRKYWWQILIASAVMLWLFYYFYPSTAKNATSNALIKPDTTKEVKPSKKPGFHNTEKPILISSPEDILSRFFMLINESDFSEAFLLTNNELWKPFTNFSGEAWGNFSDISNITYTTKSYISKYNPDAIIEASFSAFDNKIREKVWLKYDFFLRKDSKTQWKIIRMIYPKNVSAIIDNTPGWYEDDPLFERKDDELIRLYNEPHALLQDYYDNFKSINTVRNNIGNYYANTLIIHHDQKMISKTKAIERDLNDFLENDIRSYQILLNSTVMITVNYDQINIVAVPLRYYVTKNDGSRSKFTIDITAVLNKENSKIIAIGRDISVDKLNEVLKNNN